MTKRTVAAFPTMVRATLEGKLPDWVQARWFTNHDEALAIGSDAEIGWFDMYDKARMAAAINNASQLRWLNSIYAGVDGMPLQTLSERQVVLTNGAGINAITIAEYVVMGMLSIAKGYREVVRAQDRHEWLGTSPGKVELFGSKALILGYGAIGKLVEQRLMAFGVAVTVVRRSDPGAGASSATISAVLGPSQWRAQLGEFDWVILAVPATPETRQMIGQYELAAMKKSAVLLNVARGSVIDQQALTDALTSRNIAAAFLDVTDPEPLPAGHPLWSLPNAHITMHLSGNSQTLMVQRSVQRFLENLARYRAGEPLQFQVDLALGY
jgi:phosphoglycerate dehydrogenase-like enzyme